MPADLKVSNDSDVRHARGGEWRGWIFWTVFGVLLIVVAAGLLVPSEPSPLALRVVGFLRDPLQMVLAVAVSGFGRRPWGAVFSLIGFSLVFHYAVPPSHLVEGFDVYLARLAAYVLVASFAAGIGALVRDLRRARAR